jgi:tRNA threonylcarbamoyl adenosine modification protein YeaZ
MDEQPAGLILSIDTSLSQMSVALTAPGSVLGAVSLEGRESRNEKLLPAVDWLLRESGVERGAIDLLAVTRGPGSFTGVRIGLATVQGLAMALRRPLCAMSTHEAVASSGAGRPSILVHGDAGRGEFYASGFRDGEEVLAPSLLTGEQLQGLRGEFEMLLDLEAVLSTWNVALLAAHRARQIAFTGRLADYAEASPIYVRLAEAEVKLARSHG